MCVCVCVSTVCEVGKQVNENEKKEIHSNNKYVPNDASCERIQAMEALVHTSHKPLPCENRLKIHQALWHPERSNPEANLASQQIWDAFIHLCILFHSICLSRVESI